jgi:ribosomal protein S12 methylthiotransferase accessory factor
LENGGANSAPAPFDLFLASIGTCAGIYVKSFCDRRQISTEGIKIIQTMEFDNEKKTPYLFKIDIQLPSGFPEKYKEAVINAAELCLVKKTINNQPEFQVITTQK